MLMKERSPSEEIWEIVPWYNPSLQLAKRDELAAPAQPANRARLDSIAPSPSESNPQRRGRGVLLPGWVLGRGDRAPRPAALRGRLPAFKRPAPYGRGGNGGGNPVRALGGPSWRRPGYRGGRGRSGIC
jgi:hypothetical protein